MSKETTMVNGSITPAAAFAGALRRRSWLIAGTLAVLACCWLMGAVPAPAAAATGPVWDLEATAYPTSFPAGGDGWYQIAAYNIGDAASSGNETVTVTLPSGVVADRTVNGSGSWSCGTVAGETTVTCTSTSTVAPAGVIVVNLQVAVSSGVSGTVATPVTLAGGGAAQATVTTNTPVSQPGAAQPAYGVSSFTTSVTDPTGADYTQAGGHPWLATTDIAFNTDSTDPMIGGGSAAPTGEPKDILVDLPPGFIGNPQALPQCPASAFGLNGVFSAGCPTNTQVGIATLTGLSGGNNPSFLSAPVYNIAPDAGHPAEFGFLAGGAQVVLYGQVRSNGDYGLTVGTSTAPPEAPDEQIHLSFFGTPGALNGSGSTTPLLTNPTDCAADEVTTVRTDAWENPGAFVSASASSPKVTGCGQLNSLWTGADAPSITAQPDNGSADTPAGLSVDLHVPQGGLTSATGVSTPALNDTTVTLPQGVALNPSVADGLQACSESQIGLTSSSPIQFNLSAPACPDASKVGTFEVDTPLLANPLKGSVYIAAQHANPFGSNYAIYLAVDDATTGVVIKLAGKITADPSTGRLTASFTNNPQLPFTDFKLDFFTGPRAALVNPGLCGTYTTTASLSPWSAADPADPTAGETAEASDSFKVSSGANGGACVSSEGAMPFSASLSAGSSSTTAGAFTGFSFDLTRPDGDQNVSSLDATLPAGLLAKLAGVPLCPAADAASGGCPAASRVGSATVGVGSGADPLFIPQAGKAPTAVYLAGAYKGAPYSLVIKAPAQAGPFDLGTVVVRAAVFIDAQTATVTVKADPLPQILEGIPLQYRDIRIDVDRPGFMLNPTSCDPMSVAASVDSAQGKSVLLSDRFQVGGCSGLGFSPSLAVSAGTRVADSPAGLSVDLHFPQSGLTSGAGRSEATLRNASVTLPAGVSLNPSAATGLAACSESQIGLTGSSPVTFDQSAPACPAASRVGTVEVDTPLLPDPLTGSIFLAQQTKNPFGSTFAIYLFAKGDGVQVKLAGHVVADPVTGQLTTTFSDNPQVPFSDLKLTFRSGPQAVLATPGSCGTFRTASVLSSWSGSQTASPSSGFGVSAGCQTGFAPSLSFSSRTARAGAFSPFVVSFGRSDSDQFLKGLTVKLAPGMLAKLAGVPECSGAELAAAAKKSGAGEQADPSCPAASQVGTVTTAAGVGPDPFSLQGRAYLTGSYKGAPFGLAVVVPALAGPFDLGTVVVRQQLRIDPTTAQATVISDPLPQIVDGVPLRLRRVSVDLNRPGFTLNPTSCKKLAVTGSLGSTGGLSHPVASGFQAEGCAKLGFRPKLQIALSGKGQTQSGDHPTLTANLRNPAGTANLRSAKVTLPLSMALDPDNSMHVCGFVTAARVHGGKVHCKASTVVGTATAVTPLLAKPLSGKVYLVQGLRCVKGQPNAGGKCPHGQTAIRTLPSLLVALRGQIALDLRAQTSVNGHQALVTTFNTIPDAPVSKFTLRIAGGKRGILVVTGRGRSLCGKPQIGQAGYGAQSGKTSNRTLTLSTPCPAAQQARAHSTS